MKITIHVTESEVFDTKTNNVSNTERKADVEVDMGDEKVGTLVTEVMKLIANKEFVSGIKSMFCGSPTPEKTDRIHNTKSEIGYSVDWSKMTYFVREVHDVLMLKWSHMISVDMINNIRDNIVYWMVGFETIGNPLGKLLDECDQTITEAERDEIVLTILRTGDETGFIINN